MLMTVFVSLLFLESNKLGGAFVWDISEDSINFPARKFTSELTNEIYSGLESDNGGGGDGGSGDDHSNVCDPSVGCNVCSACCHPYLTSQFDCNACVSIKCHQQICYPLDKCNVCSSCCTTFTCSQMQCNYCVSKKCQ